MSPHLAVTATTAAAVFLLMLGESLRSKANERALRRAGAVEPDEDVYRTMAWAYPGGFLAMALEGAVNGRPPDVVTVVGAGLFVLAKALKYWAIGSLGVRWTFRVLVPPGAPLVVAGPYAFVRHPNYVAVIGEFIAVAMIVGAWLTGSVATVLFAGLIRRRIRVEERALAVPGLHLNSHLNG
jgi:methyltransferase